MQRLACSPVQESVTAACLGFFTLRRSHWLDVPERVKYKLSVMVHRCLNGRAPQYLATLCVPVASVASRQHICVLPLVISWRYRLTASVCTVVGLLLSLA